MSQLLTSFNYNNDFKKVIKWVVGIHVLIALIGVFGLPDFHFKKIPDLTIELSVLAPSSGGEQRSIAQPQTPQKVEKKEQVLPKDKDGTQTKEVPQTSSSSSASSALGPAAAPTVDADYKASYLKNPKPPYPPLAVKMRLEGKVGIIAEVLPDGKAGRVAIESSSGHELLDQSALQTVKQWQFTPARKDGVIITQVVRIPINFNLKSR
jgi:periplasmic protein TonB